jgi:predicted DsbA family dithiol-disulfide isomerase
MKIIVTLFCFLVFTVSLFAQTPGEILATATNKKFTVSVLDPEVRELRDTLPKRLAEARKELFSRQIAETLFELESAARKTTVEELVKTEVKMKVPDPTEAEIQAVYDANRAALGYKTVTEVRPQIIAFLRSEPEKKVFTGFIEQLKTKYKALVAKDVNAPNLKPADVLATFSGTQITAKNFEDRNAQKLYELEADIFDIVLKNLKEAVSSELLVTESVEQGASPSEIIAREITDKMREFTDEEREKLQAAMDARLFTKYKAQFFLKEPKPFVQNISVDDDPQQGIATAPVTVVMFSDFQCSACSATHPVLKKVLAEYKNRIRFVVRDYPLAMHKDSFRAALAANAANMQGKFFEYIEILYQNQDALDDSSLKKYAADLGLNLKQFELDFSSEKIAAEIRKDIADGKSYGVSATPTIYINGVKVRKNTEEGFKSAVERALKK